MAVFRKLFINKNGGVEGEGEVGSCWRSWGGRQAVIQKGFSRGLRTKA